MNRKMKIGRQEHHRFATNERDGVSGGKNDDIPALIERLIETGAFTSEDKTGLQALAPATIRAISEKFSESDAVDEVRNKRTDEDHNDFIHAGRPRHMRRELPEERASRNYRIANSQHRHVAANVADDRVARGMMPPSSRRAQ